MLGSEAKAKMSKCYKCPFIPTSRGVVRDAYLAHNVLFTLKGDWALRQDANSSVTGCNVKLD